MTELKSADPIDDIRRSASLKFESEFRAGDRCRFDVVRRALVIREVLAYYGIQLPEAQALPAEVQDICMRLMDAEQLTPALRHFL